MKFSARTIQILRNFASIHQAIIFKPGNQLKTMADTKSVMARATIDTEIEKTFAIYDLGKFLSAVSMFEEPDLEPGDSSIRISKGREKLSYTYAELSLIKSPPEKEITLPSVDVEFDLKNEELNRVIKALSIIGAPEIAITGDGESIYMEALNTKNPSESTYRTEVGTTNKRFRLVFLAENIKLLPGDYHVRVSARGLAHFKAEDIEYWVAVEQHSTFEG